MTPSGNKLLDTVPLLKASPLDDLSQKYKFNFVPEERDGLTIGGEARPSESK